MKYNIISSLSDKELEVSQSYKDSFDIAINHLHDEDYDARIVLHESDINNLIAALKQIGKNMKNIGGKNG